MAAVCRHVLSLAATRCIPEIAAPMPISLCRRRRHSGDGCKEADRVELNVSEGALVSERGFIATLTR
jgi:hypothetical protein